MTTPCPRCGALFGLPPDGGDLREILKRTEWQLVVEALARAGGRVDGAAAMLGLKRTTLSMAMARLRREGWPMLPPSKAGRRKRNCAQ